jgi:hypothetical protein
MTPLSLGHLTAKTPPRPRIHQRLDQHGQNRHESRGVRHHVFPFIRSRSSSRSLSPGFFLRLARSSPTLSMRRLEPAIASVTAATTGMPTGAITATPQAAAPIATDFATPPNVNAMMCPAGNGLRVKQNATLATIVAGCKSMGTAGRGRGITSAVNPTSKLAERIHARMTLAARCACSQQRRIVGALSRPPPIAVFSFVAHTCDKPQKPEAPELVPPGPQ